MYNNLVLKSLSKKTRYLIIFGSMMLVLLFAGLDLPRRIMPAQADSTPTPTVLATPVDPSTQSGDTEGLILGAGVILVIILLGVLIQQAANKYSGPISQD